MKPVSVVEVYTTKFCHTCLLRKCIAMSQQLLFEVSLLRFHYETLNFKLWFSIFIIMNIQ